ncbi:trypsin-like peptidase domain-containing protein [Rhodococcus rhodochrous]|uniref:trypsin-like peptidase domain-containing protein n=1 Tax=Rhodococcus rhodochrous TaxID=1829 RepID=UPI000FF87082
MPIKRLITGCGIATLLVATAPLPVSHAQPADSPEVRAAATIRPAIVYIETVFGGYTLDSNGRIIADDQGPGVSRRCTGFIVREDGYIGTAAHCLTLNDPTTTSAASQQNPVVLVLGAGQTGDDVKPVPARIVDSRPFGEGDVALLKVELEDLPAAELATDPDLRVGTPILSVGYPSSADQVTDYSLEPTSKTGAVSAVKELRTQTVYEVSAPMSKGMSGGPTVDLEGRVVGVNSYGIPGETQPFNYIVPVAGISELLASAGVEAELSPADEAYRAGLDSYYSGNYTDAIENFDSALTQSPSYPGAFELRRDSARLREELGGGESSFLPWILIAAGVVVAAMIVAGVVVFLRSRRQDQPAPVGAWQGQPPPPSSPPSAGATTPQNSPPSNAYPQGASGVRCTNCGFDLSPDQGFCPRCGKPQR